MLILIQPFSPGPIKLVFATSLSSTTAPATFVSQGNHFVLTDRSVTSGWVVTLILELLPRLLTVGLELRAMQPRFLELESKAMQPRLLELESKAMQPWLLELESKAMQPRLLTV